jgi:hypothetical protein
MANKVVTPIGLLSFPALFEARAAVPGGEPRFSLNIVFDKEAQKTEAYKALVKEVEACAKEFFQGKLPANWRNPIRDAGEKEYAGYEDGYTYISAWTKQRPGLIGPNKEEIDLPEQVFAGQKVRATVRPFGYNQQGNKGVALSLQNVQIAKFDMPRLDGRSSAKQDFDEIPQDSELEDAPF